MSIFRAVSGPVPGEMAAKATSAGAESMSIFKRLGEAVAGRTCEACQRAKATSVRRCCIGGRAQRYAFHCSVCGSAVKAREELAARLRAGSR